MVLSKIWVNIGNQYSPLNVSRPCIVRISVQPMFTRQLKPQLIKKTDKLLFCGIFVVFQGI